MTPLEALKIIYDLEDIQGGRDIFWKSYRTIEKALKALEIIKDTCDFEFLEVKTPLKTNYIIRFEDKNVASNWFNSYLHSKEEFDLLKEVLLND